MLSLDSISTFSCDVKEIATKSSRISINFEELEINDVLENIRLLLNYIKRRNKKGASLISYFQRKDTCAHGWVGQALYCMSHLHLHFPSKKSSLQKIFGFVFLNPSSTRAKRAACRKISGFLWPLPKKTTPKPTLSLLW